MSLLDHCRDRANNIATLWLKNFSIIVMPKIFAFSCSCCNKVVKCRDKVPLSFPFINVAIE